MVCRRPTLPSVIFFLFRGSSYVFATCCSPYFLYRENEEIKYFIYREWVCGDQWMKIQSKEFKWRNEFFFSLFFSLSSFHLLKVFFLLSLSSAVVSCFVIQSLFCTETIKEGITYASLFHLYNFNRCYSYFCFFCQSKIDSLKCIISSNKK